MPKPSHREKILTEGLKVVLDHGFCGASVRDIVHAAGVPQGSFTNHFSSKEVFGLEVLDLYYSMVCVNVRETLRNDLTPPLERLHQWVDAQIEFLVDGDMRSGCLIGNFSIEAGDGSEKIRLRLAEIFEELRESVAYCLKAAVTAGEIPAATDCDEIAAFLYASLQGAILQSKAERSQAPLERFKTIMFSNILR
ncbi:TetR family transcriptional regulator [Capsulimonas corticalis]|uniref:TetR family transcriptional regulator n=1 Tax=Capsulimonas corticalis TaxID=2219043 RepID=A0A402D4H0_9BACT|nr:TetR/AcrR family transcriptional regulator [Capsulimonas corticalis]BDI29163.1 TetR family transcriptional regulator [Capsulimonas corticalis]